MECKDYTVASSASFTELEGTVNILLSKGYTPVGGISYNADKSWYLQAMCKIKKE
jgi:hypothetical protein